MIHIFNLLSLHLIAKQISLFTVQCNLAPTKTTACIKTHIVCCFHGENHKKEHTLFHITKYWNEYKTKEKRHEMHIRKPVVHVCKNQGNKQYRERERETPREMSREAIFLGFHKRKVTFAKSYPKRPVARVISHLINSYHLCPFIWKLLVHPVCPHLCARCSTTFSPTVSNLWFRNNDALHNRWRRCQHLLIQFRTIQRLYVGWTHSRVCRLQRVFKARVPASTDPGSNCQTI